MSTAFKPHSRTGNNYTDALHASCPKTLGQKFRKFCQSVYNVVIKGRQKRHSSMYLFS